MTQRSNSLRVQLTLLTVAALLILAGLLETTRVFQQRRSLIDAERRVGVTLIRSVNTTIDSVRSFINTLSDISELDVRLGELVAQNDNIEFIAVTTPDGNIIFHSDEDYIGQDSEALTSLPVDATISRMVPGYGMVFLTTLNFDSSDLQEPDAFNIIVASGSEPINDLLMNSVISSVLLTFLFSLVTAFVIIWFVRVNFVHPIEQLTETANTIAMGDLSGRVQINMNNEIGQLAQSFNSMTNQLTESIDKLKHARDEALAAQRIANENSRLKSEFLSTMSHELRTPLNAIEGFTSVMLGGMGVELSPRATGMVKRVSSNSKRLLHLINDFLDLSRIESGRLEIVNEPLSPERLARKWQQDVGILAEEKGLELNVTVDPNMPETIISDEDALSKIGLNLLSNAIKFTKQGEVRLTLQREAEEWQIIVTDTGIGIPPHAREYIFDEFRQVDGSSMREYGGTGLGLSLVQKLSRALDGNVNLESEIGEGSTFIVSLPLVTPETDHTVTQLEGEVE